MFTRTESLATYVRKFPVTATIILINLLVFILLSINGGSTNLNTLIEYGAMNRTFVQNGEWYRLFTSAFLHIGLQHFLFNTFALYVFCCELEKTIGKLAYLGLYVASILGSGLAVFFFADAYSVTAGASGAIFGVFGAIYALMRTNRYYFDAATKQMFNVLLVLNVIFTFVGSSVSVSGHIGGLLTGFLITYIITKK